MMQVINKRVFYLVTKIKLSGYFTRAISEVKEDQVLTNRQIEKIRSRTADKLFGSHHMLIFLAVKPVSNFWEKEGLRVDQSTNLKLGQK